MGQLLYQYRWQYLEDEIFTRAALDTDMQNAFAEASRLAPSDFALKLRHGESFYDVASPNWEEALEVFSGCLELSETENDKQAVSLHIAKVHAELGNETESRKWLNQVHLPALERPKAQVERRLNSQ